MTENYNVYKKDSLNFKDLFRSRRKQFHEGVKICTLGNTIAKCTVLSIAVRSNYVTTD